jgi:DNA-binding GntR family transcriptional regulator
MRWGHYVNESAQHSAPTRDDPVPNSYFAGGNGTLCSMLPSAHPPPGAPNHSRPRTIAGVLQELPRRDSTALVRQVGDRLRTAIIRQELPAGARLNQVRLAEQLGVSRMPIRAAIAELAAEGLIETLATGGARVRSLTPQDLLDVYEVRTGLETQALRRLAENTSPHLAAIDEILSRHRPLVAGYDTHQLLDVDREFHTAVLDATGNPYFKKAMRPVWSIVERAMFGMLSLSHVAAVAWDEHEAIHAALHRGDGDSAVDLMRSHLQNGAAQLVALLSEPDGRRVDGTD